MPWVPNIGGEDGYVDPGDSTGRAIDEYERRKRLNLPQQAAPAEPTTEEVLTRLRNLGSGT